MRRIQQFLLLLGGIGLLLGTFLPWVIHGAVGRDYSTSTMGYESSGIITGGIGLIFLVGFLIRKRIPGRSYFIAGSILTILAGALLLYNVADVIYSGTVYTESGATTDFGSGLCLSVIAAIFIFIGGTLKVPHPAETTTIEPQPNDSRVL